MSSRDRHGAERSWGHWTEIKLNALSGYLPGFTTAASLKAPGTIYLDLFAGGANNTTASGEGLEGSARRALNASPHFGRVVLFEMDERKAASLETELRADYPGRDIKVVAGDCNLTAGPYLDELARQDRDAPYNATFALIDQYSADVRWETLERLSRWRQGRFKVELFLYFGDSFIVRGLGGPDGAAYAERVDALFGTTSWRQIQQGRQDDLLTPEQRTKELVNLMRWRLQHELGYTRTMPFQLRRARGHGLYTMIFATTNPTGEKIMFDRLLKASHEQDELEALRDLRRKLHKSDAASMGMSGFAELDEQLPDVVRAATTHGRLMLDEPLPPWTYPSSH